MSRVHAYHEKVLSLTDGNVGTSLVEPHKVELLVKKSRTKGKKMPTLVKKKLVVSKGIVKKTPLEKKKEVATETPSSKKVGGKVLKKGSVANARAGARAAEVTKEKAAQSAGKKISTTYTKADGKKKVAGMTYEELSQRSGIPITHEQFVVAVEILKGAPTRQDINHRAKELLPPTARTSSPKTLSNLVSTVIGKLTASGFVIEGSWKMTYPAQ